MASTYFKVSWEGPVLDSSGNKTKEVKSKMLEAPHYPLAIIRSFWQGPWLTLK